MTHTPPPIPPGNRAKHGPAQSKPDPADKGHLAKGAAQNTSEQGDTANIKQNTTNQGHQQDR
jgi:hypothetical protein